MGKGVAKVGFWCGLAACASALSFDLVQLLQVAGLLRFPFDEIGIYGTSLCIVAPLVLEFLALHHLTDHDKRFWTHGSLVFITIYAVFVTANYVVQLATVIPSKLRGATEAIRLLDQSPHSLFWDFDAVGYFSMGMATLLAVPAVGSAGFERWVRMSLIAHTVVTPLICIVYFYPTYSYRLLFIGFPWAFTAPLFMGLVAVQLGKRGKLAGDGSER
jgi:hypothetical protein